MKSPKRDYVSVPHGQIAYLRFGDGPPLVLIHGSLTTADDMTLALSETLARDHEVIAFDRPGHGGSDKLSGDQGSPRAQGLALLDAWHALGIEMPAIIGHSFGGAVALSLALDRPEYLSGVVALAPICFPGDPPRAHPSRTPDAVLLWRTLR